MLEAQCDVALHQRDVPAPNSPLSLSLINFLYGAGDVVGGLLLGELVDGVLGEDVLAYDGSHGGFGLVLGDVCLGVAQTNLLRLAVCGREIQQAD